MEAKWEVSPIEILRPLLFLWLLVYAIYVFVHRVVGDRSSAAVLLTIFVSRFLFRAKEYAIFSLAALAVILTTGIYSLRVGRKIRVSLLSPGLTLVSLFFLVLRSFSLTLSLTSIPVSYCEAMLTWAATPAIPLRKPDSGQYPDICYIVLGAYSSPAALKEFYGYHNSAFVEDPEALGFIVPDTVLSNCPQTALSISPTLDMQYWDSISPDMRLVAYRCPARTVLDYSRVRVSLEAIGYQSVSVATDWKLTNNETTDYYFKPYPVVLPEFEDFLIRSTPVQKLYQPLSTVAPVMTNDVHRRYVSYSLEALARIPEIPGSKFVLSI